jgi:hypothetical protein
MTVYTYRTRIWLFGAELGKDRHAHDVDLEPNTQVALSLKTERLIGDLCGRSSQLANCGLQIWAHLGFFTVAWRLAET